MTVHLLDTPGFDDTERDDFTVLREVADYLEKAYRSNILLRGIIYLHKIDDNRVRGSSRANLDMFQKLCGPEFQRRVIILTTMWDKVTSEEGFHYKSELETSFLGSMIQNGSQVLKFTRTWPRPEALKILSQLIQLHNNDSVQIQRELYSGMKLNQTGAGQVLHEDLLRQEQQWIQKLSEVREDYSRAMKRNDEESAKALQSQKQKFLRSQREVQERLQNIEGYNNALQNEVEDLRDERDWNQKQVSGLVNEVKKLRRDWEEQGYISNIEYRKSRMLEDKIRQMESNRNGRIFDVLTEILKTGWSAFLTRAFT